VYPPPPQSYPPPIQGYPQGHYVAPPPMGYPMKNGPQYPQQPPPPPETKHRRDGFCSGW
jgi:hypothetical protein